jgi:four helix bundle protein
MNQNISETHFPFPADRLVAYQVAKEVLAEIARLARRWPANLRDQAERASTSAMLNVAEGASQPPGSGAKRRHYDIALASTGEIAAALDAAGILGRSPAAELAAAKQRAGRLGALILGLVRSCGGAPWR